MVGAADRFKGDGKGGGFRGGRGVCGEGRHWKGKDCHTVEPKGGEKEAKQRKVQFGVWGGGKDAG